MRAFVRESRNGISGENGSITPLIAVVLGVAVLTSVAVGGVGQAMLAKARSQAAADAVALAVAADGIDSGRRVASANNATIVLFDERRRGDGVVHVVVVDFGGFQATAAASVDGETG